MISYIYVSLKQFPVAIRAKPLLKLSSILDQKNAIYKKI